jgi:hypothetical protein
MIDKNKITQCYIDNLIRESSIITVKLGEKTTVTQLTLVNGFSIVESSSCVDKSNYSQELGESICIERIKNKLWELEGYLLQNKLYESKGV